MSVWKHGWKAIETFLSNNHGFVFIIFYYAGHPYSCGAM